MHADVGDSPAWPHEVHGKLKGVRQSDGLDGDIRAKPVGQLRDDRDRVLVPAVHGDIGAELLGCLQPAVGQVDGHNVARGIQQRSDNGRQADGTRADHGHGVAWLDVAASESSVKVAEGNTKLAERALTQSRDRYSNGVTNYLEVVQAQEVVTGADENYIESLYSFNVAMISLARAMGNADTRLQQLLGAN